MAVFSSRPQVYKVGMVLLVGAFVMFVVGFACPYWLYSSGDRSPGNSGIWLLCVEKHGERSCDLIGKDTLLESTKLYRGLLCVSLALQAVSCGIAVLVNLIPTHRFINTTLHVLAIVAGVFGIGGTMAFAGTVCDIVDIHDELQFYWAFYFTVLGSVGTFTAGLLMVTNSELPSANNPTTTTFMTMTSQPAGTYPVSQPAGPQAAGYPPQGQALPGVTTVQAGYPYATAYPAGTPSK